MTDKEPEDSKKVSTDLYFPDDPENAEIFKTFLKYISGKYRTDVFIHLSALFWEEFFLFLLIFAGCSFRIPSRRHIQRILDYCRMYRYIETHDDKEQAYEKMADKYGLRASVVKRITGRVGNFMERAENDGRVEEEK